MLRNVKNDAERDGIRSLSRIFQGAEVSRRFHRTSLISAPEAPIVVALKKGRPPPDLRYFDQAKKTESLER
jgi:hypothetical protein